MKTLLVPVDFTAASDNALNFAAEWSKEYGYERIILLKSFYDSVFESVAVSEGYANVSQDCMNHDRSVMEKQLQESCRSLAAKTPQAKVLTAISEMPLLRAVIEVVQNEKPELILLGSDVHHYSNGSMVASHIIAITKASPTRVLIVPANYSYQPVTDALVPCDFATLDTVDKLNSLRSNPHWQGVRLQVLQVDAKEHYRTPDDGFREREERLHAYLKNFPHQVHYRNDKDIITGIKNFASEQDVQLIISLPGKHSFLYSLTHSSISEAIYRNARQPVLILK